MRIGPSKAIWRLLLCLLNCLCHGGQALAEPVRIAYADCLSAVYARLGIHICCQNWVIFDHRIYYLLACLSRCCCGGEHHRGNTHRSGD
jgi:hypothetical protein